MKIVTGITKVELTKDEIEIIRKAGQIFADIRDSDEMSNYYGDVTIGNATFKYFGMDEIATTLLDIVE